MDSPAVPVKSVRERLAHETDVIPLDAVVVVDVAKALAFFFLLLLLGVVVVEDDGGDNGEDDGPSKDG